MNNKTGLVEHIYTFLYTVKFDKTEIVRRQRNYKKTFFLKMINIRKHKDNVNKQLDTQNLGTYINFINKIKITSVI